MDVGVARADHHPVVAVEQQIAVETVGPRLHREKEAEQHRAVGDRCRRHRPPLGVVLDVAVHPIDRSGEERAQEEREKHPILDDDIGGQRKEIEADVLVVERVARAIGHLIEEPQEDTPIVDLSPGDKHGEEAGAASDYDAPRQPMAHEFQHVGQGRNARGFPLEVGGTLRPP